jgi:2-oxoglutarate dehydrogenase complex dehydrogenase (E1) component-like enzyme
VAYLEELEKKFHEDPQSIDRTWASFFANLGGDSRWLEAW